MPLIQALHAQADEWRAAEIARARKLLASGEDVDAVLEALSRGLTQKMLHGTLAELHAADGEQRAQLAQTVSRAVPAPEQPRPVRRRQALATPPRRSGRSGCVLLRTCWRPQRKHR